MGLVQISGTQSPETVGLIANVPIVGLMRNQYPFRRSCRTELNLYLLPETGGLVEAFNQSTSFRPPSPIIGQRELR